MVNVELGKKTESYGTNLDSVVIPKYIAGIEGGRSLDVTGIKEPYIKAGHIIIQADEGGDYKPMPVTEGNYGELPPGHHYAGVLYKTIKTSEPMAPIMTWGKVNEVASPYKVATIKTAFLARCPHIEFISVEDK